MTAGRTTPRCHHRTGRVQTKVGLWCPRCERYIKQQQPARHGTPAGYERHRRERRGRWKWPACEPCAEAAAAYGRSYRDTDTGREAQRVRAYARNRALGRLAERYPADYAKFYAEEVSIVRDGGKLVRQGIEQEIRKVLHLAAPGERDPEAFLRSRLGRLTQAEREAWREVVKLRQKLAVLDERVAQAREPGRDR